MSPLEKLFEDLGLGIAALVEVFALTCGTIDAIYKPNR